MGRNRVWVEGATVTALAMVLSLILIQIDSSSSISLGQIPLTPSVLRRGTKVGMLVGSIWDILHLLLGQVYYLSAVRVLIEYPIAYTFAGIAGPMASNVQKGYVDDSTKQIRKSIVFGVLIGVLSRYLWHFITGVVLWGAYTLRGTNSWLSFFVMNGASGLSTAIVTIIVLLGI